MRTHMPAVYSLQVPAATKRRVTLFLTHNIILASHCANLPPFFSPRLLLHQSWLASLFRSPLSLCAFPHQRSSQLSTFLYTKRIDHLLATCCLSQHLRPSTLRTPRARACALSCSNSRPNSQHSPLHTFFSHTPWLSMASSGTPVHSALLTRSSGARWTLLGKCLSIHLLSRLANSTSSEVLTGWTCLHFVHGISTA